MTDDTNKQVRPYTVITGDGYWGKGMTEVEAARNANVRGTYVNALVYRADPEYVDGEINCTDYGGAGWKWKDDVWPRFKDDPDLKDKAFRSADPVFQGKARIIKGELVRKKV